MGFTKKTVRDIDLTGKTVLLRVDYNLPLKGGKVTSDYRIEKSLPTIDYLLSKNCKIVLCSHMGRPEGKFDSALSLKPIAERLRKIINRPVGFVDDILADTTAKRVQSMQPKDIVMLENLRFYDGEETKDQDFAKVLADLADVFVQDAFGVVHHPAASLTEVPKLLPAVAGLLLEHEVDTITRTIEEPKHPLMAIIGGAKISDKIKILERFIDVADFVVVGGAMANTFLLAQGIRIGKSLAEKDEIPLAERIMEKARKKARKQPFVFYVPQDGVVASRIDKLAKTRIVDWDAHVFASVSSYPNRPGRESATIGADEMILDIGPFSGAFIAGGVQLAKTVIWNGTMGVTETPGVQGPVGPFAHGTEVIMDAMLGEYGNKPFTVVGGGDTVGYVEGRKLSSNFGHVSTGGGASMELMSGGKLPGVEALLDMKK